VRDVAVNDDSDTQALPAEDEGGRRHDERRSRSGRLEVDLRQRARQQLAAAIVNVDLNQQCATDGIDGVGVTNQGALKGFAWVLGKCQIDLEPRFTLPE